MLSVCYEHQNVVEPSGLHEKMTTDKFATKSTTYKSCKNYECYNVSPKSCEANIFLRAVVKCIHGIESKNFVATSVLSCCPHLRGIRSAWKVKVPI
mmetsp:Transcript_27219/g.57242  ORF Transcript_27219/g.57242 Transcript_27219/m.57242 type:complete len:96 (-) Transcript_27219:1228-1515(-)